MSNLLSLLQTVVPILVCIGLGMLARRQQIITREWIPLPAGWCCCIACCPPAIWLRA